MIVDSHCHTSDRWYEPAEVLVAQMDRLNIDAAVLTQYSGQFDNSYQAECVSRYPGRLASVVVVDVNSAAAPNHLTELVSAGAVGVRLRPMDRSPGIDSLAVWRRASTLGITVTSLGTPAEFLSPEFQEVLETFPDLPVIIEHLGTRGETGHQYAPEKATEVFGLSRFNNVHLKFHGLAEFSPRVPDRTSRERFIKPLRPHLHLAFDAFGSDRLLWGSDFPPVSAREGYESALTGPMEALRELGATSTEVDKMFGHNAARLFRIPQKESASPTQTEALDAPTR